MAEKRNVLIQLLRICACAMVFIVHFGQRLGLSGIIRDFTNFGQYGVQLFLLISGFLACKTFFGNPNTNIWEYYKKRMFAILPLYYLVILYYFVSENILSNFIEDNIPADELGLGWFRYIFILNGFFNSDTYFWSNLGITWTIPIFAFFYLIAPFILRKVKSVTSAVAAWFAVFAVTQVLDEFYTCTIFNYLHIMFLGAVIYVCAYKKHDRIAYMLFLLASLCMLTLSKTEYAIVFIFSCLILILLSFDNIRLPDRLQTVINALDSYSYTLYLMHGVVFCSLIDRLNHIGISKLLIAFIAIFGTFASTLFVGKFIEKPIQKLLKKHFIK